MRSSWWNSNGHQDHKLYSRDLCASSPEDPFLVYLRCFIFKYKSPYQVPTSEEPFIISGRSRVSCLHLGVLFLSITIALQCWPQDKSHDAENVTFLIKETICRSSAQNHGDCPFKEDGVVKRCSAAAQESRGRSLEVTCQDVDGSETSVRRGDDIPRTGRTPHVFKLLRSGGRKAESDFLQFDSKDAVPSHSVSSCIECIFDFLYPKPSSGR
ncbi:uncharacterized protein [Engystomops pustulosus]|uniref:uncharacterized protein isoform X1 n=1 Tax=Engystomops pustulosus TaxID=76066 RepID=UPI003AFAFA1B